MYGGSRTWASAVAAPPATWAAAQPGVAGRDDAVLVGEDDSLDAVGEVELQEHEANAALHGRFRYDEPLFHRAVRESARDEYEHLPLAGGNVLEQRCRLLERVGAGGESPRSAGADLAPESVEGPTVVALTRATKDGHLQVFSAGATGLEPATSCVTGRCGATGDDRLRSRITRHSRHFLE
jgi:hypothetical protein